ncbi:MAG: hypothetical protein ACRD68_03930 [Pyrinomonadaceae bacterium]
MAVYEHKYRRYEGILTPAWSRFLVIPRHALKGVFQSKLFVAVYALGFVYPLVAAIIIYLHHNVNALGILQIDVRELVPINASFFQNFVEIQGMYAFFLNLIVGPPLVSRDLTNNALPLYLCRPFSRPEYVLGKMSVLFILLSAVTWVPALLLFLFKAYLEGAGWFFSNLWVAGAILAGSWVWLVVIALLALAISAWVKWRVVASAALLGLFFIPTAFGEMINQLFLTRWGSLVVFPRLIYSVWAGLFGNFASYQRSDVISVTENGRQWTRVLLLEPPLWTSWVMLGLICAVCLLLLRRKVRAYEVVKG